MMDQRADNNGGRLTPIEQIKANHDIMRRTILHGDVDEVPWQADILPQQVGLMPVWADANGKLWVLERTEKGQVLKRMWHIA